jgi:hypothetical protein
MPVDQEDAQEDVEHPLNIMWSYRRENDRVFTTAVLRTQMENNILLM